MRIQIKLDAKNLKDNPSKFVSSLYTPSDSERALINLVISNWQVADTVKTKKYTEFNDKTLLERQSADQRRFNSYQEPVSDDPDEAWKSRAIRPITRNRAISIAAHMTSSVMFPLVHAQNENDDEDRDAAMAMRDLVEWAGEEAGYEENMVFAIISALVNPAVVLTTEYCEVFRKIKDGYEDYEEDGKTKKRPKIKKVLDEVYSGFKDGLVPLDELWIPDFYQRDIQKQPYVIRRRVITYDIAQEKYGDHPNFTFVTPGIQIMHIDGENQGQFYNIKDSDLNDQLCEEVIYWDRGRDLHVYFLNGIPMCDPDRGNGRVDKKYPLVMFGFEPINDTFAFYKSVVNKMSTDEDVIQTLYRMIIDGTYLQLMPPQAIFGSEDINASIMVPGLTTAFESEDVKMQTLSTGANLTAGLSVLQKVESSATESSIDPVMSGQQSGGSKQPQTAFEISRLENNARVMLGMFGKMIGFAIKKFAELRISDICQYITIAEVGEISGGLKYKNVLLSEKSDMGQSVSKKIMFDGSMPDEMTHIEKRVLGFEMLDKEEKEYGGKTRLFRVNPALFRKLKYKIRVTADVVLPPSDAVKKALNLEAYDRAITNPVANQEAIYRDFLLGSYAKSASNPDKYVMKQQPMVMANAVGYPLGANMKQPGTVEAERAMRNNNLMQENRSAVMQSGV